MTVRQNIQSAIGQLGLALEKLDEAPPPLPHPWVFPVGSVRFPVENWYTASVHDLTGRRNGGYGHTGLDLNVWDLPRGDVDRGQPVYAIADGVVVEHSYSASWLGSIIIKVEFASGVPLWVRYWHLAKDNRWLSWNVGDMVRDGSILGAIGNYKLGAGGDHLHLDMAMTPFGPHWWWTRHPKVQWVDPVPVLKAKLDPALVDAMLARGN